MPTGILRLSVLAVLGAFALPAADNAWSWSEYRKAIVTPSSLGKNAVTAGIAQWRDSPPEWGQGMAGYGRRYGSRVATHAVQGTARYSVAHWRGEDITYHRSEGGGEWTRLKYAVKTSFIVPKVDGSGTTISASLFAGAYTGAGVSRFWHPEDRRTVQSTFFNGSASVGYAVLGNIVKEFMPRKKK